MLKQAKVRASAEFSAPSAERHFKLNPDMFSVLEDYDGGKTLVMRQIHVEPMFEQAFNEDFEQWMKDRGINPDYVQEAVEAEVENQQIMRILTERLLDR